MLQGGSVLAKSGRQYSVDNIGLSSTKAIEFGEIKQNKGYYAVQGHSRSKMSVTMERPYTINLRLIGKHVVDFLVVLIKLFSLAVTAEALQANME